MRFDKSCDCENGRFANDMVLKPPAQARQITGLEAWHYVYRSAPAELL